MTRVFVNGLYFNVEVAGEGSPLVLLHGFTGSTETWAPFFDAFGAVRTVVAVDLLGHGRSDAPRDPARYRVERATEDLIELLDKLGLARVDLLGYSMGGRVALNFALAAPARVASLVLESTSPGIDDASERASRVRSDETLAAMVEREGIEHFVDYWERLPLFATQGALDPAHRGRLRAHRLAGNPIGFAGSLRGLGAGQSESVFGRLAALSSTLLIAGELDEKYARFARRMGEVIPAAQIAIVPGTGHAVHLEQPTRFAQIVLGFLNGEHLCATQPETAGRAAVPTLHAGENET